MRIFVSLFIFFFSCIHSTYAEPLSLKNFLDVVDQSKSPQIAQSKQRASKKSSSKKSVKKSSDIIKKIEIAGTFHTSKAAVFKQLFLKAGDTVSPIKINRNIKNVKSLGVFQEVKITQKPYKSGKRLSVTVVENPLLGNVKFEGNTVISDDELMGIVQSKENGLFNVNSLRKDIKAIDEIYHEKGYIQEKVYQIVTPKKDKDPLIFKISEGVVDAITVTGNTKTRDYVILRELLTKPGSVVHDKTIREDIRRIFNLNYFKGVEPHFPESATPNHYTLDLHITERDSNAQFSFGGGYSPRVGFSMFTDLYWDNFLGTGQLIALKGQFGRANTYQFKYYNPWMWDDRKSFTFKTWLRDGQVSAVNPLDVSEGFRDEVSKGVEVGIGWPYSYEFRSSHFVKYEDVKLTESDKRYTVSSYTLGLTYDDRDIRYMPLNGNYHTFYVEKGFDLGRKSLDFTKYDLTLQKYFQTFESQTIATRFSFGLLKSPRINEEDLFSREIYYLGGSSSIRGYEEWPPIFQGTKMALATVEYRFYFNDMFQAVLFTDAGFATDGALFRLSKYKMGKGIGARIRTPLGPLRLDFGLDELGVGRFHFNIGHSF